MRSDDGLQDRGEKVRSNVRCKIFKAGARALAFFVSRGIYVLFLAEPTRERVEKQNSFCLSRATRRKTKSKSNRRERRKAFLLRGIP